MATIAHEVITLLLMVLSPAKRAAGFRGPGKAGCTMRDNLETTSSITINAPAAMVWEALTTPELIKQWFFGVDTVTDWNVGSPIVHRGEYQGRPYEDKGSILRFEPPSLLVHSHWSPLSGMADRPEHYQEVSWSLVEREGQTELTVAEANLPSDAAKKVSEKSWRTVLDNLKSLLESQAGQERNAAAFIAGSKDGRSRRGTGLMTRKRLFILNGAIAGGYAIALLAATNPLLTVYGISANPEATFMARWFGVGLLGIGLTTWLARDAAESHAGQAVGLALAVTYGVGVVLAFWGTLFGPFNALGWIAVGLNLLLGSGFAALQFTRSGLAPADGPS
jgi:uncharacterized protein YndB with AHSA1/START domain